LCSGTFIIFQDYYTLIIDIETSEPVDTTPSLNNSMMEEAVVEGINSLGDDYAVMVSSCSSSSGGSSSGGGSDEGGENLKR